MLTDAPELDPAAVALALAHLRAEGDEEGAAHLLHMIGDTADEGDDAQGDAEDEGGDDGDDADMDAVTQAALESLGVGGATEQKGQWDENKHKRDGGKFSSTGGAGGSSPAAQIGRQKQQATARPGAQPARPTPPPIPDAHHDEAARNLLAGRPKVRLLLPNMQGHDVTDGASLKEFYSRGGQVTIDDGKAKAAASAVQVQNRTVLDHVNQWAATQADKHADKVAVHFGIDRARAHALLVNAIKKIAEHAKAGGGWGGAGIKLTDKRSGKTASIAPKGGTPVSAPRPTVGKAMDALTGSDGGFLVEPGKRRKPKVRPGFAEFLKALCDQRS